ncbi:ankyrin [Penicillium chrysogenum]|uniref:Ankyrin n=1 Tax=Penicillium chrysogenum TaxID=5076 RepID=A0ABQ8WXY2_PENCH|nr:ankyrin [Penicillium chrysogenum]
MPAKTTTEFFLENKANFDIIDKDGYTTLYTATVNGHLEVMRLLIDIGANITISNKDGWLTIHFAYDDQDTSTSENFYNDIDLLDNFNRTPLFYTARDGYKDMVEILLPHSSIDFKDRYGATPLYIAVRNSHEDVVKQLTALSKQKSEFKDSLSRNLL